MLPILLFLMAAILTELPLPPQAYKESARTTIYLPWMLKSPASHLEDVVLIPAGEFRMGCDPPGPAWGCPPDEQPGHTVYLDAYEIDRYEVTNADYAACVADGACKPPWFHYSRTRLSYYGNPLFADHPVTYVDWYQAEAFCRWAGKRLPSEAEWEKAARGDDDSRRYPWGDAAPGCSQANLAFCLGDTAPVGSYPQGAGPYGGMDLAGNVWEWVADWYQPDYYRASPPANPGGPLSGTHKILRGGSWFHDALTAQSTYRFEFEPGRWSSFGVGFRCAR